MAKRKERKKQLKQQPATTVAKPRRRNQKLVARRDIIGQPELRAAAATLLKVSPDELPSEAMNKLVEQIEKSAAADATLLGELLAETERHLHSIKCFSAEESIAYGHARRDLLCDLYGVASQVHPSPTKLQRLAIQYLLDARQPIEGSLDRFQLRPGEHEYELVVYPAGVPKTSAIPYPGRVIRELFSVALLDCVLSDPPQIYRLMHLIENRLGTVPAKPEPSAGTPVVPRASAFSVDLQASTITLKDKTYVVDWRQATLASALHEAEGLWVSNSKLQPLLRRRADRVCKDLPEAIRPFIESQPGKGYRLRTEDLA